MTVLVDRYPVEINHARALCTPCFVSHSGAVHSLIYWECASELAEFVREHAHGNEANGAWAVELDSKCDCAEWE